MERVQRERDEQERSAGEQRDHRRRGPSPFAALLQPHEHGDQSGTGRTQPGEVERALFAVARVTQQRHRHRDPDQADGHVDQEQPAPTDRRHDQASEHRPDRRRGHHRDPEVPERPPAFCRLEQLEDHRHRHRDQQSAAHTLQHAGADQHRQGRRDRAEHRRQREQHQRGDEGAAAPEAITDPTTRQLGDADRDEVGGDHPLDTVQRAEVALQR